MEGKGLLFAETSIHISRSFGTRESKNKIRERFRENTVITSRHVEAEYKRAVVGCLCILVNLLRDSDTVADALVRLSKYRDRNPLRILQVIGELIDRGVSTREDLIDWCELLIRHVVPNRFLIDIGEVVDNIGCLKGSAEAVFLDGVWRLDALCREHEHPRCRTDAFVADRLEELTRVQMHLSENPDNIKNQGKVLLEVGAVLTGERVPYGRRCQRIADVLIALEAPADSRVYTEDSDYEALCHALGKDVLIETRKSLRRRPRPGPAGLNPAK